MTLKRKYLDEVQLARVFALIGVLFVHSSSTAVTQVPPNSSLYDVYNFLNIAGKLGTPTFIFLSSFVLFYTYYNKPLNGALLKRFYSKRLLYVLLPYLLFSIFYFLIRLQLNATPLDLTVQLPVFFEQLATGKAYPHLYFVFISVQFYLMFPLLLLLFKKIRLFRKYAVVWGIIIQWSWVYLNSEVIQYTNKGSISLSYFMFYFAGAFIGIYYEQIVRWLSERRRGYTAFTAVAIGYVIMVVYYVGIYYTIRVDGEYPSWNKAIEFAWSTHAFFALLMIFWVSHMLYPRLSTGMKRAVISLGSVSFGIYLIHPMLLLILRASLPGTTPFVFHGWQLFSFLTVLFGSWLIVWLIQRFVPFSWILFGQPATKRR